MSKWDTKKRHRGRALKTHFHQRKTFKTNVLKNNPPAALEFQGRFIVIFSLAFGAGPKSAQTTLENQKAAERHRLFAQREAERDNYCVVNIAAPSAVPCRPGGMCICLSVAARSPGQFFWFRVGAATCTDYQIFSLLFKRCILFHSGAK